MCSILVVVAFLAVVVETNVPTHRQFFLTFSLISHYWQHLVAIKIGQSTWFQVTNNSVFYPQLRISNKNSSIDSRA